MSINLPVAFYTPYRAVAVLTFCTSGVYILIQRQVLHSGPLVSEVCIPLHCLVLHSAPRCRLTPYPYCLSPGRAPALALSLTLYASAAHIWIRNSGQCRNLHSVRYYLWTLDLCSLYSDSLLVLHSSLRCRVVPSCTLRCVPRAVFSNSNGLPGVCFL